MDPQITPSVDTALALLSRHCATRTAPAGTVDRDATNERAVRASRRAGLRAIALCPDKAGDQGPVTTFGPVSSV